MGSQPDGLDNGEMPFSTQNTCQSSARDEASDMLAGHKWDRSDKASKEIPSLPTVGSLSNEQ